MSRRTRDRRLLAVGLVLVGGAIVWTWWVYRLPPAERNDALGFSGLVLGLVSVLGPLMVWLGRGLRHADSRPVDALAALLAHSVYGQWRKEADERRLVTPAPIPFRWSLSALDVAGPVAAAVGTPDAPPAFRPLPGYASITEADLRAGGGRRELHRLYSGLASGRIIVVGAPGAGKSGAAILLLLDALEHRDQLDDAARARCPIPVLFTAHDWNPVNCSVRDWLAAKLAADYPLFARRSDFAEVDALLDARDKVALILDGLDEMDEALRPAALQALSDAPFRVVVLTRSPEMVQAASREWLIGAVAAHLHDVTAPDALDYLHRARTGPPPSGWTGLLTHLSEHPDGVLARGLSTPLTLTLLRDTYQPGDNVSELLDTTRYGTSKAIEHRLISRVLPAAYARRAGRPPPPYTEEQAHKTLAFIARQMGWSRDLAWWQIRRWTPTAPRVLATGLTGGLAYSLGLVGELGLGLAGGLGLGLAGGLAVGLGLAVGPGQDEPRRIWVGNWRAILSRRVLGKGFTYGLAGGLVCGLALGLGLSYGLALGLRLALGLGPAYGLALGLAGALTYGLLYGVAYENIETSATTASLYGPRDIWRSDRMVGLMGGFAGGFAVGFEGELTVGLAVGFVVGLTVGVTTSATWPTKLACLQLRISERVPAVDLIAFLQDARERGMLRTVGAVYQFRHATLQDQLADQASPSSLATSAVPRTS